MMTKQLSSWLGFFCFLLATSPVLAEPSGEQPQPQIGEIVSELTESLQFPSWDDLRTTIDLLVGAGRARDVELPPLLIWKLTPYAPETESFFEWPTLSASKNETFQADTNPHNAVPIKLSFPATNEAKIEENLFLASPSELRRSRNYRWNAFEEFTMGVNVVDDKPVPAQLEKISRQESDLFLPQMSSATSANEVNDWRINLNFQPLSQLGINFDGNYLSSQFGVNWQPVPGLTFTGSRHNQSETLAGGIQFSQKSDDFAFSARANLDSENRWRWGVNSNLGDLQLSYQTNGDPHALGMNSQVGYSLFKNDNSGSAHLLKVGYETRDSEERDDRLTTVGWRYQSGNGSKDDPSRWEFDVSYGMGSQGTGWVTSVSTTLGRGLVLRARYQGVSLTSDDETFKLELLPNSR